MASNNTIHEVNYRFQVVIGGRREASRPTHFSKYTRVQRRHVFKESVEVVPGLRLNVTLSLGNNYNDGATVQLGVVNPDLGTTLVGWQTLREQTYQERLPVKITGRAFHQQPEPKTYEWSMAFDAQLAAINAGAIYHEGGEADLKHFRQVIGHYWGVNIPAETTVVFEITFTLNKQWTVATHALPTHLTANQMVVWMNGLTDLEGSRNWWEVLTARNVVQLMIWSYNVDDEIFEDLKKNHFFCKIWEFKN